MSATDSNSLSYGQKEMRAVFARIEALGKPGNRQITPAYYGRFLILFTFTILEIS